MPWVVLHIASILSSVAASKAYLMIPPVLANTYFLLIRLVWLQWSTLWKHKKYLTPLLYVLACVESAQTHDSDSCCIQKVLPIRSSCSEHLLLWFLDTNLYRSSYNMDWVTVEFFFTRRVRAICNFAAHNFRTLVMPLVHAGGPATFVSAQNDR